MLYVFSGLIVYNVNINLQRDLMENSNGSSTDHHVALNAADGTKSQDLTYSYQNGMHTFSIPLKVVDDPQSTKEKNSTDKCISDQLGSIKNKNSSLDYHLVEAVSFELAPTGFSREGESVSQEFTLVPSGSKPFGARGLVEQHPENLLQAKVSVQDTLPNHKLEKNKKTRKRKISPEDTKKSTNILKKTRARGSAGFVTELGDLYKRSRNIKAEERLGHENVQCCSKNPCETASRLGTSESTSSTRKDTLGLPCEWRQCSDEFNDLMSFMKHVSEHIKDVQITEGGQKSLFHGNQGIQKQVRNRWRGRNADQSLQDVDIVDEDEEEEIRRLEESVEEASMEYEDGRLYCCLWRNCGYVTQSKDEIIRHINFHTFHTKLKSHGATIWKETGIDPCTIGTNQRNVIPELNEPLVCQWEGCLRSEVANKPILQDSTNENANITHQEQGTFSEPLKFYWHVAWHSEEMREANKHVNVLDQNQTGNEGHSKLKIPCKWKDCTSKVGTVSKLKDHLRVHSQERAVACPVCGGLFTNKSKFYDHCKRQAPECSQKFKCSYCNKKFATERLLRDHMRAHVNHYKCPLCEMTCPVPSALAQHMAYRHFQVKSFGCEYEQCHYRAKTNADLRNHMRTHLSEDSAEAFYHCGEVKCNFKAKAKATVKQHKIDMHPVAEYDGGDGFHQKTSSRYVCHMCDKAFARGAYLTQHFLRIHKFRWPSGHSRFRYKKDERTGQFHLQTIRFESAELHNASNQQEDAETVLQQEDQNAEENEQNKHVYSAEDAASDKEGSGEENNFLTFGNIFEGRTMGSRNPSENEEKLTSNRSKTVTSDGSFAGLDAIIAAASVLDGKNLDP